MIWQRQGLKRPHMGPSPMLPIPHKGINSHINKLISIDIQEAWKDATACKTAKSLFPQTNRTISAKLLNRKIAQTNACRYWEPQQHSLLCQRYCLYESPSRPQICESMLEAQIISSLSSHHSSSSIYHPLRGKGPQRPTRKVSSAKLSWRSPPFIHPSIQYVGSGGAIQNSSTIDFYAFRRCHSQFHSSR